MVLGIDLSKEYLVARCLIGYARSVSGRVVLRAEDVQPGQRQLYAGEALRQMVTLITEGASFGVSGFCPALISYSTGNEGEIIGSTKTTYWNTTSELDDFLRSAAGGALEFTLGSSEQMAFIRQTLLDKLGVVLDAAQLERALAMSDDDFIDAVATRLDEPETDIAIFFDC